MIITIEPKCKRAKERVKQHGDIMRLRKEGSFNGQPAILVQSLHETWRCEGVSRKWNGWFTKSEAGWFEMSKEHQEAHG